MAQKAKSSASPGTYSSSAIDAGRNVSRQLAVSFQKKTSTEQARV